MNVLSNYYKNLNYSYDNASNNFFIQEDFDKNDLKKSLKLFNEESIRIKKPSPKNLEVYALLSGISFDIELRTKLFNIQNLIKQIIPKNIAYFVIPKNFGLEHCVFNWPNQKWNFNKENIVNRFIDLYNFKSFNLEIKGIQIHTDGCIIAKGFDKSMEMIKIRNFFEKNLDFYPKKQSKWSHIPLGRILEPIGEVNYKALKKFAKDYKNKNITSAKIINYKFIHETKWYMEEKKIIKLINV